MLLIYGYLISEFRVLIYSIKYDFKLYFITTEGKVKTWTLIFFSEPGCKKTHIFPNWIMNKWHNVLIDKLKVCHM